MLFSALRKNQTITSSTRSSCALNNRYMGILFSLSQQQVTGCLELWCQNLERSRKAQCTGIPYRKYVFLFSYSVLIYTQFPPLMGCILNGILFGLTRIPIPSSSQVPLLILDCGIFPRSRGTLRPSCHILTYQSTEVKHAKYIVSVSIPTPASLQCGPPSARDVVHPPAVTLLHLAHSLTM